MVRFIVDNMHVGTPYSEVVREFYRRFKRARDKGHDATRAERKKVYRQAIKVHRQNRQLCIDFRL